MTESWRSHWAALFALVQLRASALEPGDTSQAWLCNLFTRSRLVLAGEKRPIAAKHLET